MSLILNATDLNELYEQAPVTCPDNLVLDDFEELTGVPEILGRGYSRGMELLPGVWLNFLDRISHQDWEKKQPDHEHLVQIGIFLSGCLDCSIHPILGGTRGYFSGSGISPGYVERHRAGERLTLVDIEIEPGVLESFFLSHQQRQPDCIQQLFKGEDWKVSFYPRVTPAMRSLVLQLWNAPYRGVAKQIFLQAKVFELLAMHLDLIAAEGSQRRSTPNLKPATIARLHHARDILTTQFAHPPTVPELAQQVGLSVCTLQRGFQTLFHTTVIGYLQQRRLEQAERLLRQPDVTVAEVALQVGYEHLGRFAGAFKRQFGITPSQCLAGRLINPDFRVVSKLN